jgi:ribosomal protein S18 acetylase RimI-like enzyme
MALVTLKRISENDIPALQKIALPTWESTYLPILSKEQVDFMYQEIYTEEALKKQMQNGQQFFFILEEELPVGFLSISLLNSEESRYKLNKLYLLSERQGGGLGRKALKAAAEYVKSLKGKVLELNVNRYNPALFFYEKCGYSKVREVDIPIGKYWMNDFVMEKQLA